MTTTALTKTPQRNLHALRWITVSMAVALGAFAAFQLGPWLERWRTPDIKAIDIPAMTVAPALPAPDMKAAILGTDASHSDAPLVMRLVATSPGRNSREGTAALGVDVRNPQTYVAGAQLANGSRLTEIYLDHVVLERGGQRTVLTLGTARERPAPKDQWEQMRRDAQLELAIVGGQPRTTISTPGTKDQISDVLRAAAHFENGKIAGFVLYPGTHGAALRALGLRSGDVLRAVDGLRVEGEAQWDAIASALTTGGRVNVSIEREGALQALTLDANALSNNATDAASSMPGVPLNPPPGGPAGT